MLHRKIDEKSRAWEGCSFSELGIGATRPVRSEMITPVLMLQRQSPAQRVPCHQKLQSDAAWPRRSACVATNHAFTSLSLVCALEG